MGSIDLAASPVNAASAVLAAERLNKRYLGTAAVRDVSFAIEPGQILGYLGPNGSGKSTTVKMLTGLLEPTTGQVRFRGEDIRVNPLRFKSSLGYVPDEPQLFSFLTGWEHLEFISALREMSMGAFKAKASKLLQLFGLWDSRDVRMAGYSKGMRQRVMLIAALLHNPEVLILDEPFSGLDVTTSLILRELLHQLAQRGKAIFFSSPSVESFEHVCTHVLLIRKGVPIACGTLNEITAKTSAGTLESAFLQLAKDADARQIACDIVATL